MKIYTIADIEFFRQQEAYTIEALSKKLGISSRTYNRWLRGTPITRNRRKIFKRFESLSKPA